MKNLFLLTTLLMIVAIELRRLYNTEADYRAISIGFR
jgi:hypothetical protein